MATLAQMMDSGMHGDGWGWGWVVGLVLMVALVVIAVLLVVRMTSSTSAAAPRSEPTRRSAEEVLADRLARGEIDTTEYRERLDALRSG